MLFRILQIKDIPNCEYPFMRLDFAKEHGFDLEDYYEVYKFNEGTLFIDNADERDVYELLEITFRLFNRVTQEDVDRLNAIGYHGHSLSRSDIVEVDGVKYYCDSFGWEKI